MLCMNPLDLLKVKFQVSTSPRGGGGGIGRGIWLALRDIHASEGWRGLYRGLSPNIAGNASSWGLYFLLLRIFSLPFAQTVLTFFCSCFWTVITSSSVARRSARRTDLSRPRSTSSIPPKRVRIFLLVSPCLIPSPTLSLSLCKGAATAILTNPIWVVKVRTFTAPSNSPAAHRGLWSAFPARQYLKKAMNDNNV